LTSTNTYNSAIKLRYTTKLNHKNTNKKLQVMAMKDSIYPFGGADNVFDRLYYADIDEAASKKLNKELPNGGPDHAIYNIDKLLEASNTDFRAVCQTMRMESELLNSEGYPLEKNEAGEVLPEQSPLKLYNHSYVKGTYTRALVRGVNFKFCIQNVPDGLASMSEHPFVKIASDLKERGALVGSIEIRKAKLTDMPDSMLLDNGSFSHNFILSDDRALRLETVPNSAKAMVNYAAPKTRMDKAIDLFEEKIWPHSDELISIH
jgi:hypothetical protein